MGVAAVVLCTETSSQHDLNRGEQRSITTGFDPSLNGSDGGSCASREDLFVYVRSEMLTYCALRVAHRRLRFKEHEACDERLNGSLAGKACFPANLKLPW